MLDNEQTKNLKRVYTFFLDSELKGWTEIDDYLEFLEWLDDDQLHRECDILYEYQKTKNMDCPMAPHKSGTVCFVKSILEAVESILELYKETGNLHKNNRYILCYYQALCHTGQIVELSK